MTKPRGRKTSQNPETRDDASVRQIFTGFFSNSAAEITQPTEQIEATRERKGEAKRSSDNLEWYPKFRDTDNLFPQNLAWAYRVSPTHRAVINSKIAIAKGDGFKYMNENGDEVENESVSAQDKAFFGNPSGVPLYNIRDLYNDMLLNWVLHGEMWLRMKRAKVGNAEAWNIQAIDGTQPRIMKTGDKVRITPYWEDVRLTQGKNIFSDKTTYQDLDIWDMTGEAPDEFAIFIRRREPGYDRYGVPDYVACLKDAVIEYLCDTYNKSRLENGFFPDIFITYVGQIPGDKKAGEFLQEEYRRMKGSHEAGKPRLAHTFDKDGAPIIHEFNGSKDGEFLNLEESAFTGIIRAHRWFPSLAGIQTAGQLGSNQQLRNEYKIALNYVVKPDIQEPVLEALNKVLETAGIKTRIAVINKPPIGLDDNVSASDVMTVNQQLFELGMQPLPDEYTDDDGRYVGDMMLLEAKSKFGIFLEVQRLIQERDAAKTKIDVNN